MCRYRTGRAVRTCVSAGFVAGFAAALWAPLTGTAQQAGHSGHDQQAPQAQVAEHPPLYDNLGDHHYAVTTREPRAQAYFDQGLRLYYAFNHSEAVRSFREAQRIDPTCAMCFWGEALAFGPNINKPIDEASAVSAYAALEQALAVQNGSTEVERALIGALAERYVSEPVEDRSSLDQAYAAAMRRVVERQPDHEEAGVLYAESLMDLRPWDYWTEAGEPQPGIEDALGRLGWVMEANPNHPGACHFYIHAVEKLYPERAVPCAERLAGLMPGAGHIVHMPGHIYIRVGRYRDAIEANKHAVHADESYIQDQRPGMTFYTAGYYPHNYDFLAFAALMLGDQAQATSAAAQVEALIPEEMYGEPGTDFLQHWSIRPLLVGVRFEQWKRVLDSPAPLAERTHALAIWHYARGRAFAATGEVGAARAELAELRSLTERAVGNGLRMEFNTSADILNVATAVLAGWADAAAGRFDNAADHLRKAVRLEDRLLYGEPPEWTVPVRQELGAVLLMAGRPDEAADAFREDLEHFPENHWSVEGLATALAAGGA
jgi:tetratricopeptide (TPR) repeat protein